MIEGDVNSILSMIGIQEKRAKEHITKHYAAKEKGYMKLIMQKRNRKKEIMKEYYDSIAKNAEEYLKKEYNYIQLYEDYKVLLNSFNDIWIQTEKNLEQNPKDYVCFALAKFKGMMGNAESAVASDVFYPFLKKTVPTELSKKTMDLRLYKGKAYADFSPSFLKEFIMPIYADKTMGED